MKATNRLNLLAWIVLTLGVVAIVQPATVFAKVSAPPSQPAALALWSMSTTGPLEHGLKALSGAEGNTSPGTRGGLACLVVAKNASNPATYFYMTMSDPSLIAAGTPTYVTVQYFDSSQEVKGARAVGDHITIDYDSDEGDEVQYHYAQADSLVGGLYTGSDVWRTAVFELDHARFHGDENLGADFRFEGRSLAIHSVRITSTRPTEWATLSRAVVSVDVRRFGAKGDGFTDDTAAFQNAMNSLYPAGGTVNVPTGNYLIASHLTIPNFVTLQGVWSIPSAFAQMHGTTLLAVEGAGRVTGTPFITLNSCSTIKGVIVYYPKQDPEKIIPYPWCIASAGHSLDSGGGDNPSIIDCLLVNPYQAVDFGTQTSGRHYIRNLYGQPLYRGIYVSQCYDVGRIENVHFWPFWNNTSKHLVDWVQANGEAYVFGRADWEYVFNTVAFGYNIGYHFIDTPDGACNGNFSGLGSDSSGIAVQIDQTQTPGLLFTNGEFVAMMGPVKTQVVVSPSNKGVAQFVNCSFWGPSNHIAQIAGSGFVTFNACNLREWNAYGPHYAIVDSGGRLTVSSCVFASAAPQLQLQSGAGPTIFFANQIVGSLRIDNPANVDLQQGFNAVGP